MASSLVDPAASRSLSDEELPFAARLLLVLDARDAQPQVLDEWLSRLDGPDGTAAAPGELLVLGKLLRATGSDAAHPTLHTAATRALQAGDLTFVDLELVKATADLLDSEQLRRVVRDAADDRYAAAPPEELKQLVPRQLRLLADAGIQPGEGLVAFVFEDYLPEPGLAAALRPSDWVDLAQLIAEHGSEGQQREFAELLESHLYLLRVPYLRHAEVRNLLRSLRLPSAGPEQIEVVVAQWLRLSQEWDQLGDLQGQLVAAVEDGPTNLAPAPPAASKADRRADEVVRFAAIAQAHVQLGSPEAAKAWARAALAQLHEIDTAGSDWSLELAAVGDALDQSSAELNPQQVDRLIALLEETEGRSHEVADAAFASLAAVFERSGATETLRDRLFNGEDGEPPVLPLLKILAWADRKAGNARDLHGELLRRMPAEAGGDERARWELACAYAAGLLHERFARRTDGNGFYQNALIAAASDPVRLQSLGEFAMANAALGEHEFALRVIRGVKAQLGEEARLHADAMEAGLVQRQAALRGLQQQSASPLGPALSDRRAAARWRKAFEAQALSPLATHH